MTRANRQCHQWLGVFPRASQKKNRKRGFWATSRGHLKHSRQRLSRNTKTGGESRFWKRRMERIFVFQNWCDFWSECWWFCGVTLFTISSPLPLTQLDPEDRATLEAAYRRRDTAKQKAGLSPAPVAFDRFPGVQDWRRCRHGGLTSAARRKFWPTLQMECLRHC